MTLDVPEGSLLNCTYPAACGNGTGGAISMEAAVAHDCIARMLYAGGIYDDVMACIRSYGYPERGRYGGHNQFGGVVQQQIYHFMASGLGATPAHDGVHTGGHPINPQAKISDVEMIEMNYPLMFLSNNQLTDSGGWGMNSGGVGSERMMMVYGSDDFTDNHGIQVGNPAGKGLFGGYPAYLQDFSIWRTQGEMKNMLASGRYPSTYSDVTDEIAEQVDPLQNWRRIPMYDYDLFVDQGVNLGGSGFGDPLRREPQRVADDVGKGIVSVANARIAFGVAVSGSGEVDLEETKNLREAIFLNRRIDSVAVRKPAEAQLPSAAFEPVRRFHHRLVLGKNKEGDLVVRCECGTVFGGPEVNYKEGCLRRVKTWEEAELRSTSDGRAPAIKLQEYFCPGCLTLLEVDLWYPDLDDETPVWDVQLAMR